MICVVFLLVWKDSIFFNINQLENEQVRMWIDLCYLIQLFKCGIFVSIFLKLNLIPNE